MGAWQKILSAMERFSIETHCVVNPFPQEAEKVLSILLSDNYSSLNDKTEFDLSNFLLYVCHDYFHFAATDSTISTDRLLEIFVGALVLGNLTRSDKNILSSVYNLEQLNILTDSLVGFLCDITLYSKEVNSGELPANHISYVEDETYWNEYLDMVIHGLQQTGKNILLEKFINLEELLLSFPECQKFKNIFSSACKQYDLNNKKLEPTKILNSPSDLLLIKVANRLSFLNFNEESVSNIKTLDSNAIDSRPKPLMSSNNLKR